MTPIKDYVILKDKDEEEVSKKVNNFLANGYQLYGNLMISDGFFIQCLVEVDLEALVKGLAEKGGNPAPM